MATPEAPVVLKFPEPFQDDTAFFKLAVEKFLRENNLADFDFLELTPSQQSKIINDAQEFKTEAAQRRRFFASNGHEGAVE
jgi:hypothetical protein